MRHSKEQRNAEEEFGIEISDRPRRNRMSAAIRRMVRETRLDSDNLVLPLFVCEGRGKRDPIAALPGVFRHSIDTLVTIANEAWASGIPAVALFPIIPSAQKDSRGEASNKPDGLLQRAIGALKQTLPDLCIITDVALDPYSSDGHDGLVEDGEIVNDATLDVLAEMAIAQADAGANIVAPSDMMDGRVGAIRMALDETGHQNVGILAYSAKYASAFYGPFRKALGSTPAFGDKKTYQMDPANRREAIREVMLDLEEGADIVLIKPALAYLDVIASIRDIATLPVAAYSVSGEYAMIKAAAAAGVVEERAAMLECITAIRRAGADIIFTYAALDIAKGL